MTVQETLAEENTKLRYAKWLLPPEEADPELDEILRQLAELELPDSDGEPLENNRERLQIGFDLEIVDYYWRARNDYYAGGNMFLYYDLDQARRIEEEINNPALPKRAYRGPDFFVVLDVDGSYRRQKWVTWLEGGRYPDVIVEFLSPTTRKIDLGKKKDIYEQIFRTSEYFCFDYLSPNAYDSLLGWRLDDNGRYQPIKPDERGWLWSERLNLWLGKWQGTYARDTTSWLRFYTPAGDLVLTEAEAEREHAEAEYQRAEAERERADAESAARKAAEEENERLRAELARLRAETS